MKTEVKAFKTYITMNDNTRKSKSTTKKKIKKTERGKTSVCKKKKSKHMTK